MGGLDHRVHKRLGRVEVVAVHADIGFAVKTPLDAEPVDERRIGLVVQAAQHRSPGLEGDLAAVGERARHALDAAALAAIELVGLALELGPERLPQPAHGAEHRLEQIGELVGGLDQAFVERADVAFLAEPLVLAGGAGAHLLAHQGQELLGRAHHRAVGGIPARAGRVHSVVP